MTDPANTLEEEIIARVRQLDATSQQVVLEYLRALEKPEISTAEWLAQARAFREEQRTQSNKNDVRVSAQDLLDEVREEASEWPRG